MSTAEQQEHPRCITPAPRPCRSSLGMHFSDLGTAGEKITSALERMSEDFGEAITVIAHHLDFEGYRYLKTYSPVVHEFPQGRFTTEWAGADKGA